MLECCSGSSHAEHLHLEHDLGLPYWKTSERPDRQYHVKYIHSEHRCPPRMCAESTALRLIRDNNDSVYREEVQWLGVWCKNDNLSVNFNKGADY